MAPIAGVVVAVGGGGVLGVFGYRLLTRDDGSPWWEAVPSVAISWTFLVAGLIAWWRRPASRVGPLLLLVALALLLRKLQYSGNSTLFTFGFAIGWIYAAAFMHVVLGYPSGRVRGKLERRFMGFAWAIALLLPLAVLLVYDPRRSCLFNCSDPGRVRPESLISVTGNHALFDSLHDLQLVGGYGLIGGGFVFLIVRRLLLSSPHMRRRLTPLLVAGGAAGLRSVSEAVFAGVSVSDAGGLALFSFEQAAEIAVPIALLVGLLGERLARAHAADLLQELASTPPAEVAGPVARALDDPSVQVAYWMPARRGYVDAEGRPFELPAAGARRAVTMLENQGRPVAAIVHDPVLLEEPKLLESVCTAARMSLENARLHAELQAQLLKVRESRTRIVAAADEERGRIERDLHDGAQQRLVALALDLRLAERELTGAAPETKALLESAVTSLQTAVQELRELAHGIYPAILIKDGLAAALRDLAENTSVRVTVEAPAGRLSPDVEATAYFVACEALANAVKHSGAGSVAIEVTDEGRMLLVTVDDDGRGGADSEGQGLRGLADRVEARGGRLWVESPPGGGTRIAAEIPCAS